MGCVACDKNGEAYDCMTVRLTETNRLLLEMSMSKALTIVV